MMEPGDVWHWHTDPSVSQHHSVWRWQAKHWKSNTSRRLTSSAIHTMMLLLYDMDTKQIKTKRYHSYLTFKSTHLRSCHAVIAKLSSENKPTVTLMLKYPQRLFVVKSWMLLASLTRSVRCCFPCFQCLFVELKGGNWFVFIMSVRSLSYVCFPITLNLTQTDPKPAAWQALRVYRLLLNCSIMRWSKIYPSLSRCWRSALCPNRPCWFRSSRFQEHLMQLQ